jgi:hypothetical protein
VVRDPLSNSQTDLREALNRDEIDVGLGLRYRLTPLTTAVGQVRWLRDRFEYLSFRNADGFRATAGLEFSKLAIIGGVLTLGYGRFVPTMPDVPTYSGLTAAIELSTVVRDRTRLSLQLGRDFEYSYMVVQPYYIRTEVGGGLMHRITPTWDFQASTRLQRLSYVSRVVLRSDADGLADPVGSPEERGMSYSLGIGYRLPYSIRVGVDGRRFQRISHAAARGFVRWQVGGSITYGF